MLYICVCSYYYICGRRAGGTHARLFFRLFRPKCFGVLAKYGLVYWMPYVVASASGTRDVSHYYLYYYVYVLSYYYITTYTTMYMCCHTTIYICVLILLYMCPHTSIYVTYVPYTTKYVVAAADSRGFLHGTRYYDTTRYHYVILCTIIYCYVLPYMCPHTIYVVPRAGGTRGISARKSST
jgi:hypothetical protein